MISKTVQHWIEKNNYQQQGDQNSLDFTYNTELNTFVLGDGSMGKENVFSVFKWQDGSISVEVGDEMTEAAWLCFHRFFIDRCTDFLGYWADSLLSSSKTPCNFEWGGNEDRFDGGFQIFGVDKKGKSIEAWVQFENGWSVLRFYKKVGKRRFRTHNNEIVEPNSTIEVEEVSDPIEICHKLYDWMVDNGFEGETFEESIKDRFQDGWWEPCADEDYE